MSGPSGMRYTKKEPGVLRSNPRQDLNAETMPAGDSRDELPVTTLRGDAPKSRHGLGHFGHSFRFVKRFAGVLALAAVLTVLLGGSAQASTVIVAEGAALPYQQWVDEAKVPTPAGVLMVIEHTDQPGDCNELALACTDGETIWVSTWIPGLKKTFMHELGHVFAYQHPELAAFEDERFADIYSLCARLARIDPQWAYSAGEGLVPGFRLRRLCYEIRH